MPPRLLLLPAHARSLANWLPLLGHAGEGSRAIEGTLRAGALAPMTAALRPDILLLPDTHRTPLEEIGSLAPLPDRPMIVGCQHGYVQKWARYAAQRHFDRFITFGRLYLPLVGNDPRFLAGSLPKLDLIRHAPDTPGRILFAAQTLMDARAAGLIAELGRAGFTVIVRDHPAAPGLYAALPGVLRDRCADLNESFAGVEAVLSSGSTLVLEALAARKRAVVLPFWHGHRYAAAGIVAGDFTLQAVTEVLEGYQAPGAWASIEAFLEAAAGPSCDPPGRARHALGVLTAAWQAWRAGAAGRDQAAFI